MMTVAVPRTLPAFQHHAEYKTLSDLRQAAKDAGYIEVLEGNRLHHFEKPPEGETWWTRKMGFTSQGGVFGTPFSYLTYSYS